MKLCSVTITSFTKEKIIADAVRSVLPFVEHCHFLCLDEGKDNTLDEAYKAVNYFWQSRPVDLSTRVIPFVGDISHWRNEALGDAHDMGYEWACMLDTDWRYRLNGADVAGFLVNTKADVVMARRTDGHYVPAFFRLPAKIKFEGVVHEDLLTQGCVEMPRLRLEELPKSREDFQRRLEADIDGLQKQLAATPDNIQWNYMAAETAVRLGQIGRALYFYECSEQLAQDETLRAWVLFRHANVLVKTGDLEAARDTALAALLDAPGMAELHWTLSTICLKEGQLWKAVAWANQAVYWGASSFSAGTCRRQGLADYRILYEEPFRNLSRTFERLGMPVEMERAARRLATATEERLSYLRDGVE